MPRNIALVGKVPDFAGLHIAQLQAGDFFVVHVVNILDNGVGEECNFFVFLGALQHDLRGAETPAAMNDCDLGGEARQENRLFHGGIAAADHGNFLARKKEAVASGAGRNAVSDQLLLVRQSQPARRGAAGDDESARMDDFMTDVDL